MGFQNIDLSILKDLHQPISPSIFPLAIGWWLLLLFFICTFLMIIFLFLKFKYSLKHSTLKELEKIKKNPDTIQLLKQLNILAKRVAIQQFSREKISSLYQDDWIRFMNFFIQKELFSKEYVDLLNKSMYAKDIELINLDRNKIIKDYETWIRKAISKKGDL